MVMTILAKVEVEKSSFQKSIWQFYVRMGLKIALILKVCNCSMFCCTLLYVHSSFATILMGKRELVALLS